jgi:hypothetical protein
MKSQLKQVDELKVKKIDCRESGLRALKLDIRMGYIRISNKTKGLF